MRSGIKLEAHNTYICVKKLLIVLCLILFWHGYTPFKIKGSKTNLDPLVVFDLSNGCCLAIGARFLSVFCKQGFGLSPLMKHGRRALLRNWIFLVPGADIRGTYVMTACHRFVGFGLTLWRLTLTWKGRGLRMAGAFVIVLLSWILREAQSLR